MPYLYPPAAPTISGDLETISRFLQSPTQVSRALRTLLQQRYISDSILSRRFQVQGGAVLYETGEVIYTADTAQAVNPGSEYPLTPAATGVASIAATVKWGQDSEVTDEAIKRQLMDVVNRVLQKLANQNVKTVDAVALAAIASAVTQTAAAAAAWTSATAAQILNDVLQAVATIRATNNGYEPDTIVVSDVSWANALGKFVAGGFVPRETGNANPALTGNFPNMAGLNWLVSPNLPVASTAFVLDSKLLGGMADEDLGGPGYSSAGGGIAPAVQVKTIRDDEKDLWRLRCRRVTVPIVVEPAAAFKITGV